VGFQLCCFIVAYLCKFDTITDLAGSANFIFLVVFTLFLGAQRGAEAEYGTRALVLTALVVVSRLELALFLLYRVCVRGSDARFDEVRGKFFNFLLFWIYQMFWAFLCCSPVIFVNTDKSTRALAIGAADYTGWTLFIGGFVLQIAGDWQKYFFRADPSNKGRFCTQGVWQWSRHPNYAGEILMWWGIFIGAYPAIQGSSEPGLGWWTIASPLYTMGILLFLTGLPFGEGKALARFYAADDGKEWEDYREKTSPIWPLPPSLYVALPMWFKRVFLCEFEFLEYHRPGKETPGDPSQPLLTETSPKRDGKMSCCR